MGCHKKRSSNPPLPSQIKELQAPSVTKRGVTILGWHILRIRFLACVTLCGVQNGRFCHKLRSMERLFVTFQGVKAIMNRSTDESIT